MKCVRSATLVVMLALAGCGFAQEKKVGYDLGTCSPDSFYAVHVEYADEADITVTEFSPKPDKVVKLKEPTVFKFSKKDKDGKHYVAVGGQELIVVKADEKVFFGALLADDGKVIAVVFGVPGDGSKLADNAKQEFGVCLDFLKPEPSPDTKTS